MKNKILGLFFILSFTASVFAQEYVSPTYKQWVTKSADFMEQNQLDSAEYALNQAIMSDPKNAEEIFYEIGEEGDEIKLIPVEEKYGTLILSVDNKE